MTPMEMLKAYAEAGEHTFKTKQGIEEVIKFYHLPCTLIGCGADEGIFVVNDLEAARSIIESLTNQAQEQHYGRSEIVDVSTRTLASDYAEITGAFVRYDNDAQEISRRGFT